MTERGSRSSHFDLAHCLIQLRSQTISDGADDVALDG